MACFEAQMHVAGQAARVTAFPVGNPDYETAAEMLLFIEMAGAKTPEAALLPPDLPRVVWTADAQSTDFRTVDGAAEEFLGYPIGHWLDRAGFFEERIHPDDRESTVGMYQALLSQGGDGSVEFRAVTASGQVLWCRESIRVTLVDGSPTLITGVLTSIERRKQLENQLLAAGHLDAVQSVAARLAVDLKDPLVVIQGNGRDVLQSLEESAEFEGLSPSKPLTRLDVAGVLAGVRARVAKAAGPQVIVYMNLGVAKVWAYANATQLAEVILTLASSDREGADHRMRLIVTCDTDVIAERLPESPLAPGKYARIVFRDDGRGHPPRFRCGSLAQSRRLIREWGGDIATAAEPLHGTAFALYLPYAERDGLF